MADLYLLRTSLLDALRPKRLATAILLTVLPAIAALLGKLITPADRFDPVLLYNSIAAFFVFGITLNILAVTYGTGALSAEIEGRTIVYLLTRPLPRWRLLLMKLIGAWIGITVTTCLATLLLGLAVYGLKIEWPRLLSDLRILPIGALAYSSLFLLFATLLPRPLLWALVYGFGWEYAAAFIQGGISRLSLLTYLRALAPHLKETIGSPSPDEIDPTNFLMRANPITVSATTAWLALGGTTLVTLCLALFLFSRREYVPREEGG